MKPLLVLARITFVGCLWSIVFIEGIRVIVLENWRFDIFWPPHWAYAWNLWQSGWVIDTKKEWAFVLILVTFIPLWLIGWIALSLVPWETILYRIISFPFRLFKKSVQPIAQVVGGTPVITKRKSYKEIRPQGKRVPIYDYTTSTAPVTQTPETKSSVAALSAPSNAVKDRAVSTRETINHTIFDLDDEDDDFDLDIDSFDKADIFKIDSDKKKKAAAAFEEDEVYVKPKRVKPQARFEDDDFDDDDDEEDYAPRRMKAKQTSQNAKYDLEDDDDFEDYKPAYKSSRETQRRRDRYEDERPRYEKSARRSKNESQRREKTYDKTIKSNNSLSDVLHENGYAVLHNVSVGLETVDLLGVCADRLLVCLIDKEKGDWLADEERFNGEDPLWFSENAHRISPVQRVDSISAKIQKSLEDVGFELQIIPYVIITSGNVINAEDMLDIWADLDVKVVRFADGSPVELPLFSKAVKPAEESLSEDGFSKLKKVLKRLG